jgi:chromate reductase, NAD(P)H dehydrogenase (quinone)
MNTVLVFAGSTRQNSYNRRLAAEAARLARLGGAEVTHIELADFDIPLYNADLETRGTPPDVIRLKALMHAHAGWLICSPEYNGGLTALLKNTIDWCSSPVKGDADWADGMKPFRGKVVGLLAASPGALGGIRSLGQLSALMLNLQCWVTPAQFALSRAGDAFDADGRLAQEASSARVAAVVKQVLFAAQRLAA